MFVPRVFIRREGLMSVTRRNVLALAVGIAIAAAAGGASAAEPIRFAVTDVEGLERLQVEFGPFKDALETASGMEFQFFPVSNRTAAAEALRSEKVDLVLTGPAEYVVLRKKTDAYPVVSFGRPDYFSAIIVMADSGLTHPSQLKGEKVAFSGVGSTSGHLGPMQLLADYGVDPREDIKAIHTSRNIMHEALKNGSVAAIGYNYRSWVSNARNKDTSVPPGAFRVIARGGDLPNDVLMAGRHVDPKIVDLVRSAFDSHHDDLVAGITAHEENDKYIGMKFLTSVKDSDYDRVRQMYAVIGYPQYAEFVGD